MDTVFPADVAAVPTCQSCGRLPARAITVRRHVGMLVLQRSVTTSVIACRSCGGLLVGRYTLRTLWQGWWGVISFFVNWFVLAANAAAWLKLRALERPTLSGDLVDVQPTGFAEIDREPARRPWLRRVGGVLVASFLLLGIAGWAWDAGRHDHDGAHGAAAAAADIERAMTAAPFTAEGGRSVVVSGSSCVGDGEAAAGGFTHFKCRLTFPSGSTDEVLVHLLAGDELFFKSAER